MKKTEFDHKSQQWDQYKEFYNSHGNFTEFATGETIVLGGWRDTSRRKCYGKYGVDVFYIADQPICLRDGAIMVDPNTGEKVLRSWLPPSSPLLYDAHTERIVRLGVGKPEGMPSRFHYRAYCYWGGPERNPVGGIAVRYARTNKLTKEERAIVSHRVFLVKAQVRINAVPEPTTRWRMGDPVQVKALIDTPFEEMSPDFKHQLVTRGYTTGVTYVETAYLQVSREPK